MLLCLIASLSLNKRSNAQITHMLAEWHLHIKIKLKKHLRVCVPEIQLYLSTASKIRDGGRFSLQPGVETHCFYLGG